MSKSFKASDGAKRKLAARLREERKARRVELIKRLWERSESPDDIWAEMARESELAEAI